LSAAIKIEDLYHWYEIGEGQRVAALAGVDLEVQAGEFLALVGANGSGKSTLARHLNALLMPHQGRVLVNGIDTADQGRLWEVRCQVGMVFQNPDNQLVATIVEDDVAFGPENLGLPPAIIRERVDCALEAVGMSEHRRYPPHHLSGGQKQRVAIAGVLAMQPNCIVLDEPTAMLDPQGRQEVLATVRRLNKQQGITVILITHFMEEAIAADRVAVMADGRLIHQGTPREVFARQGELYQAGLDIPQVTELADRLRASGVSMPPVVLSVEELVSTLCS